MRTCLILTLILTFQLTLSAAPSPQPLPLPSVYDDILSSIRGLQNFVLSPETFRTLGIPDMAQNMALYKMRLQGIEVAIHTGLDNGTLTPALEGALAEALAPVTAMILANAAILNAAEFGLQYYLHYITFSVNEGLGLAEDVLIQIQLYGCGCDGALFYEFQRAAGDIAQADRMNLIAINTYGVDVINNTDQRLQRDYNEAVDDLNNIARYFGLQVGMVGMFKRAR